jgi:hypothetical protein
MEKISARSTGGRVRRYANRRDENDPVLAKGARALGWWLIKTDKPGDYLGGYRGAWYIVEIKNPEKHGHADEFTEDQKEFHVEAYRRNLPVLVWRTVEDVYRDSQARRCA